MKKILTFFIFSIVTNTARSQNVAINNDGTPPSASAMLDIKNANKGLLIPRVSLVSETDAVTIPSPVLSLLVYNTNAALPEGAGFYFWNGNNKWSKLATLSALNNSSWGLAGNSAINPNNDFIGTTDNQPLIFKTNNILSGKIAQSINSVFFGQHAGENLTTGTNNTLIGDAAGGSNTSGSNNLFIGHLAGNLNNSGSENVFAGQDAGKANTIGARNVFVGEDAGTSNNTGSDNIFVGNGAGRNNTTSVQQVAIGSEALAATTTGDYNVAVGYFSLKATTTGSYNTSTGQQSLSSLTTGGYNTAGGHQSLSALTNGSFNTAFGNDALQSNMFGSNNTAIGADADVLSGSLSNATAIGSNAKVSTSNTMAFGDGLVNQWVFGRSTTSSPGLPPVNRALEVGTNGTNGNGAYLTKGGTWTNTSSRIKKEGFLNVNATDLLQKISQLSIQKWKYKGTDEYHIGPVAEDFYQLFGLGTDDKGISTVDPAGIALAAIKEQQQIIEKQSKLINELQKRIDALEKK
ncbi:MAG: tail fiber domain-containing protein [Ginsengibacter sp.]